MKHFLYIVLMPMLLSLFCFSCSKISGGKVGLSSEEELYDSLATRYKLARQYMDHGKNVQAIMEFRKCILTDAPDEEGQYKIQPIVVESMLDLLNVYQMTGNSMACVGEFERLLKAPPTKTISNLCMRDLHVLYAYSLYLIDGHEKEAENLVVAFLNQPLKGPETYESVYIQ